LKKIKKFFELIFTRHRYQILLKKRKIKKKKKKQKKKEKQKAKQQKQPKKKKNKHSQQEEKAETEAKILNEFDSAITHPASLTPKEETEVLKELIEEEYDVNSPLLYELFAVIIHRGTAYSGHYHALIRDLMSESKQNQELENKEIEKIESKEKPITDSNTTSELNQKKKEQIRKEWKNWIWYDFNDSNVELTNEQQVVEQYGGTSQCAYMLVYRKRGTKSLYPSTDVGSNETKK